MKISLQMTTGGTVDDTIGPDVGLYCQVGLDGIRRDEFRRPLILNTPKLCLHGSEIGKLEPAVRIKGAAEAPRKTSAASTIAAKYAT